jgi:hypothetical protein
MAPTSRMKKRMAAVRAAKATRLEAPLCEELRALLDDESEEGVWMPTAPQPPAAVHWEGDATDDEEEEEEYSDEELTADWIEGGDVFTTMKQSASEGSIFERVTFPYQRGPAVSEKTKKRKATAALDLERAAMDMRPLDQGFLVRGQALPKDKIESPVLWVSRADTLKAQRKEAILRMQKMLSSKKISMLPQNLERHWAVLGFLKYQQNRRPGETREEMALSVARSYERGLYFAHKLITWELAFLSGKEIPEGKRGCHSKTRSWFNDEGVLLAAREWIASAGEGKLFWPATRYQKLMFNCQDITAYGLAKAVGVYLDSQRATTAVLDCFETGPGGNRIRARTARRWLKQLGLKYGAVTKGVYVDGHERPDVVEYRQKVFIPRWKELQRRFVVFREDGTWEMPKGNQLSTVISTL